MMKILSITTLFSLFSCQYQHNELKIINKSNEVVYYETYFHSNLVKNDVFNKFQKIYYLDYQEALNPQDSVRPANKNSWNYDIVSNSKDSTLTVAFFNKDTVKKYGWDKIIKEKKYKIFTYKTKNLKDLNWIVEYKGDD